MLSAVHTIRPEAGVSCQDTDDQENKPQDNAAVARSLSNIVTSWDSVKSNKRKQPDVAANTGALTIDAVLTVEQPLFLTTCSPPYELHTHVLGHYHMTWNMVDTAILLIYQVEQCPTDMAFAIAGVASAAGPPAGHTASSNDAHSKHSASSHRTKAARVEVKQPAKTRSSASTHR